MRAAFGRIRASKFARFLVSGGLNTAATYALYLVLLPHTGYGLGYSIAFLSGVALAYVLNREFVFGTHQGMRSVILLPVVYLAQYGVGLFVLWLWIDVAGWDGRFGPLAVIIITVPTTFLLSRLAFVGPGRAQG